MKIKVSELTGAALDWAVGRETLQDVMIGASGTLYIEQGHIPVEWRPSANWAQGGPIIEREKIRIEPSATHSGWFAVTDPGCYAIPSERHYADGPTPLIAAMRCYVASKLGDEVEIPDALTGG